MFLQGSSARAREASTTDKSANKRIPHTLESECFPGEDFGKCMSGLNMCVYYIR